MRNFAVQNLSLEQFLEQVARRGSWFGGGSVAALSAALAAALLEKLLGQPQAARRFRRIRRECIGLIRRDAVTFARVIEATRGENRLAFQRTLESATEVPCQVFERAQAIREACRVAAQAIKPRFRSDLTCAMALADAAGISARALIDTNLAWLNNRDYAAQVQRRLRLAARTHGR